MKLKTQAAAGIAAAAVVVTIGVSAPAAQASVSSHTNAAVSVAAVTPHTWMVAYTYPNSRWGSLACGIAGVGMQVAGLIHGWYCALDEQSNRIFLWVNK